MSGTIIPLFPRRAFDYSNVSNSNTIETIIVKAIDVSAYTEGTLIVRVHSGNVTSTASLKVLVKTTAPTSEDPATDFVYTTTAVGTATINNAVTLVAPTVVVAQLSAGFGGMVQISILATQVTGATIQGELSAELVLKA